VIAMGAAPASGASLRPSGPGRRARVGKGVLALLLVPLTATAADAPADLPKRRSGLWQIATSVAGAQPASPVRLCVDEQLDDLARQLTEGAVSCAQQAIRREGDRFIAESVCRIGGSTATTRAVFTGSFDAAYRADIRSTYVPPLLGRADGQATIDATWLGPCPPEQRPGDLTLGNGTTINLYDARDGALAK